jgi:hypothetical protein
MHRTRNFFTLTIFCLILLTSCSGFAQGDTEESANSPTRVVVRILDLDAALTVIPTATLPAPVEATPPTISVLAEASPTPSPSGPRASATQNQAPGASSTPSCSNQAEFIKHLTVSDNTALESAQPFTKIWQIKNSGTCTWTEAYALVFFSGEAMNGPESVSLPSTVKPGETIDLSLNLLAPTSPDYHTGYWVLQDGSGSLFGFGEGYDQPISVTIFIKPTPPPPPS